jgi:cystathionine beta-lyase/cystathionine gamma-synthase
MEHDGHEYGRISNPTRDTLEGTLASLEKAKYCVTFGSGLAAVSSTFFLLNTGDHIVTCVYISLSRKK